MGKGSHAQCNCNISQRQTRAKGFRDAETERGKHPHDTTGELFHTT